MQNTWEIFSNTANALSSTRGNTRESISLVANNLFLDETPQLIATVAINDFGDWSDGSLTVTSQRLFVSYAYEAAGQILAQTLEIPPIPKFSELQSNSHIRVFQIAGINVQAVGLLSAQHEAIMAALDRVAGYQPQGEPTAVLPQEDPVEALGTLKRLLDQGLVSQAEYDSKKQEILGRL